MKASRLVALTVLVATVSPAMSLPASASELQLCLARAADYSAVYPTRTFPTGSTEEVSAVVRLPKGQSLRKLEATWTVVDVGTASAPGRVINKTTIPMAGKDRAAVFMRSGGGPLPPGTYRLDVAADGKPWRSAGFSVAPVEAPVVRRPADLLALKPGTVWRYAFVQQFGAGVKPQLPPGTTLDGAGRLRATLTKTAVGQDDAGMHVETRRDGALVEEEWWKVTGAGLVVTKMRSGGEEAAFDPPGPIWPWPLKTPRGWTFQPPGEAVAQAFRMWGPVLLKTPAGERPGYVVLMEQRATPHEVSVERQYVPGVGMVREVVTQARNGMLLTGWESVLAAKP